MKQILTTFLLLITLSVNAQTVDSTNITEAERIIDKYSEKVITSFNEGVAQITPLATEGFELVVRLQIVEGLVRLLPLFLSIIFLCLFLIEYRNIQTILNSDNVPKRYNVKYGPWDEHNISTHLIIYFSLFLTFVIMAMFCTHSGILHLFVPEWYAIKEIMELF